MNKTQAAPWWQRLLAALVLVVLTAGITVGVVDTDGDGKGDAVRVTREVPLEATVDTDGAKAGRQDGDVQAPAAAVEQAAKSELAEHDGLRSENPPGVTPAQLDDAREQQERLAADDQLPAVTPDAAPQQAGCRTRLVHNYSSRRGVRPRLLVLHYTVSANRAGWGDVDAVTALFNTPAFAASSNYVVDREGHCAYLVRESDKAWTQATANPVSISWEIINSGREGTLTSGAGRARLVSTLRAAAGRWQIPLRAGAVRGCTVARSGVVTHQQLGACGGGHVDVSPYQREVQGIIASARGPVVTATDRATCRKLNWWRTHGRPKGKAEANAVRRKRALSRRGVTCTSKGPRR